MNNLQNLITGLLQEVMLPRLIIILISIVLILVIGFYIKKGISAKVSDITNKYRARKATSIFGYILIIAIGLMVFSDKLGNVNIALILAGAGIAFALQEVITSFAGWISILLGQEQKLVSVLKLTTSLAILLTLVC